MSQSSLPLRTARRWIAPGIFALVVAGVAFSGTSTALAAQPLRFEIAGRTLTLGGSPAPVAQRVQPITLSKQAASNSTVAFNLAALSESGVYCYLSNHEELEAAGKAHAIAGYLRIAG